MQFSQNFLKRHTTQCRPISKISNHFCYLFSGVEIYVKCKWPVPPPVLPGSYCYIVNKKDF